MLGPRLVLVFAWMMSNWYDAFDKTLVAFLAWVFVPWTSLAWMFTYFNNAGEVSGGGYIVLMIIAVIIDLGAWGGAKGRN